MVGEGVTPLVPLTVFNAPHTLRVIERLGIEWADLSGTEGKFGIAGWQRIRTTPEAADLYTLLGRHLPPSAQDEAFKKCWGNPELRAAYSAFVLLCRTRDIAKASVQFFAEAPTDG